MPLGVLVFGQASKPALVLVLTSPMKAVIASWVAVSSESCLTRAAVAPSDVSRSMSLLHSSQARRSAPGNSLLAGLLDSAAVSGSSSTSACCGGASRA